MMPAWQADSGGPGPGDRVARPACPGAGGRRHLPSFRPAAYGPPDACAKTPLLPDGVTVAQGILVPFV